MAQITRESFLNLLAAVHNICPEAEPGDDRGENCTNTALETAEVLFDLIEREGPGHREGVLCVVNLLTEVCCAEDQEAYAKMEANRGWNGQRVDREGATIVLPLKEKN